MKKIKQKIHSQILPQEVLFERGKKYLAENQKLLDKYGIRSELVIHFPKKKKLPFLSKIALKTIRRQGGVLDTRFFIVAEKGRDINVGRFRK
jgi:hypothetical protein